MSFRGPAAQTSATPTSRPIDPRLVEFAWSAWTELGVSSWGRQHQNWHLDPEALLILTGSMDRANVRLRGEVLDWCASFGHLLSRARTKTLLASWPEPIGWAEFAADLGRATGQQWPGASGEGEFSPSGKSTLPLRNRAACIALRSRALLGVSARSEIVRVMLLAPAGRTWNRSELAEETVYTRRNVHDAVESLLITGAIGEQGEGNRARQTLSQRDAWTTLLGPLPAPMTGAAQLLRAAWAVGLARARLPQVDPELQSLEARAVWQKIEPDFQAAGWPTPALPAGRNAWTILDAWSSEFLDDLAAGSLRQR